jgi:hypothetical protein
MATRRTQDPLSSFSADLALSLPSLDPEPTVTYDPELPGTLPLCGFESDEASQRCNPVSNPRPDNAFIFRVWRDAGASENPTQRVIALEPGRGFVARKFRDAELTPERLDDHISRWRAEHSRSVGELVLKRLSSVEDKLAGSPFIPTTLNFFWAYWWAGRVAVSTKWTPDKRKIYISVIRARDLDPDLIEMPLQYCESGTIDWNIANTAQEVLVYGRIPESAVAATVSLFDLEASGHVPAWMQSSPQAETEYYGRVRLPTSFRDYARCWSAGLRDQNIHFVEHMMLVCALSGFIFSAGGHDTASFIPDMEALSLHQLVRIYHSPELKQRTLTYEYKLLMPIWYKIWAV